MCPFKNYITPNCCIINKNIFTFNILVHKLVNAHDDLLNVFGMVPSTTSGGFGSAILIDFKKLFSFELTCLYSNSQRIREQHNLEQNSNTRLLASHNRLLAKDVNFSEKGPWLSDNIIKVSKNFIKVPLMRPHS